MDYYLNNQNAIDRLVDEWLRYGKIIISYDYDDTIYDFHNKGRTYNDVINLLREAKEVGAHFVVFTASEEKRYSKIEEYLLTNNVPYDKINEGFDFAPKSNKKIYANIFLDDRAGLPAAYEQLKKAIEIVKEKRK